MKRRAIAGALGILFMLSALVSLSGCGTTVQAADLMADIKANAVNADIDLTGDDSEAIASFSVELFQNTVSSESDKPGESDVSDKSDNSAESADKNPLISPLSVLCALAMTANGAKGETLAQMEDVFGLPVQELNGYLHAYMDSLPSGDKYKVSLANSIWFKDDGRLKVERDFLQTNADYYGASI